MYMEARPRRARHPDLTFARHQPRSGAGGRAKPPGARAPACPAWQALGVRVDKSMSNFLMILAFQAESEEPRVTTLPTM
jgi:hypothetical protein